MKRNNEPGSKEAGRARRWDGTGSEHQMAGRVLPACFETSPASTCPVLRRQSTRFQDGGASILAPRRPEVVVSISSSTADRGPGGHWPD